MAVPEISEFSYGFALTNELVRWAELSAAPIFPSLIEEGGPTGGFDVKLDRPGAPLYLQFKRSECMFRRSAREWKAVTAAGGDLALPYYRFAITEALKSDQHELLLELDNAPNLVFYAAPRFHEISEINAAWQAEAVSARSVFVAPSQVGSLDEERHSVAFDGMQTWVCTEPRQMQALTSRDLLEKIQGALTQDDRPLGERLQEIAEDLRAAEVRGRNRAEAKRQDAERRREDARAALPGQSDGIGDDFYPGAVIRGERALTRTAIDFRALEAPEPRPPIIRERDGVSPERRLMSIMADEAARVFDAQLVFVQPRES
ncbi:MAG: hypothetical protein Q8Q88_22005 [Phenylobacterium sp.]|uniref:hypothetical protein n=1 Tax=Phenylobacterium sp. TaxID=1871053 RepID=UPI00273449EE|nr:hypothetical protein [Phenylobacterium sp.]MDP3749714.1 hypothetical protein [Phenylobacterium sp.]